MTAFAFSLVVQFSLNYHKNGIRICHKNAFQQDVYHPLQLLPRGEGGLCPGGFSPGVGLCQGDAPCTVMSGRYASYWNALVF